MTDAPSAAAAATPTEARAGRSGDDDRGVVAMAVAVARDRVTAAFLTLAGGYLVDGVRLLRVIRPAAGPNSKTVLVEDCYTLKAEEMDRAALLKMRVVRFPPGLD